MKPSPVKRSLPYVIVSVIALVLFTLCMMFGKAVLKQSATEAPVMLEVTVVDASDEVAAGRDPSDIAASSLPTQVYAVTNADGAILGKRIVIHRQKDDLCAITQEAFRQLKTSLLSDDIVYYSVLFEDGTCLVLTGNDQPAIYGKRGSNDYAAAVYGIVIQNADGVFQYLSLSAEDAADETTEAQDPSLPTETTAEATQETTAATAASTQTATVYITASGAKFHRESCAYLRSSKIAILRSEAQSKGYTPCSRCQP